MKMATHNLVVIVFCFCLKMSGIVQQKNPKPKDVQLFMMCENH